MKNITEFINESKSSTLINKICRAVGFDKNEDKDVLDKIQEFLDKHNTKLIDILTTEDFLDENEFPKSARKWFNTNEKDYEEISKSFKGDEEIYSEEGSFGFEILASNNILSIGFKDHDPLYVVCK